MGRQTAGRELRDRRTRPRLQGEGPAGCRRRDGWGVPAGDAATRLDAHDRRLVRASRPRHPRAVPLTGQAPRRQELRQGVAKAESKNSLRAFAKLTRSVDGELRIVSDPPADHACRGCLQGHQVRRDPAAAARADRPVPQDARRRRPAPRRGLPVRARRAQGGRRWQRGDARLDRSVPRQGLWRPALPPGEGGGGLRAGGLHREEQSSGSTADAWSRASD